MFLLRTQSGGDFARNDEGAKEVSDILDGKVKPYIVVTSISKEYKLFDATGTGGTIKPVVTSYRIPATRNAMSVLYNSNVNIKNSLIDEKYISNDYIATGNNKADTEVGWFSKTVNKTTPVTKTTKKETISW